MSGTRYSDKFKVEAVRLVVEDKQAVPAVAAKLGITTHSLYAWLKKSGYKSSFQLEAEISRLKKAIKRVTDERDALKKAQAYFLARSE
ncbi:transposase [Citrobacter cronae]|jgi:transposase-like protein|uniref:transposase n=1 Tax=Enterobacteriaceae TaxID=543 RepID=UPI0015E99096|nr:MULTISPECIES: transposase [Enterobacteriaceae]MBE0067096.1 transposase [Citrobacter freundii]MBJ8362715.1 transposase [Citrobacter cronae]MDT9438279.1 transposase [Escherichia coli]QLR76426.1 transposase [Citrobacter freundii]HEE9860476.1 transposase [Citrobacter freundii]